MVTERPILIIPVKLHFHHTKPIEIEKSTVREVKVVIVKESQISENLLILRRQLILRRTY